LHFHAWTNPDDNDEWMDGWIGLSVRMTFFALALLKAAFSIHPRGEKKKTISFISFFATYDVFCGRKKCS